MFYTRNNISQLSNKVKSEIYGNFAIYNEHQFNFKTNIINYLLKNNILAKDNKFMEEGRKSILFNNSSLSFFNKNSCKSLFNSVMLYEEKPFEEDYLNIINDNLLLATKFNEKSFKYWHNYSMFNYKFVN